MNNHSYHKQMVESHKYVLVWYSLEHTQNKKQTKDKINNKKRDSDERN